MTPPLASALVAAFNEERRISECLESLLSQTYAPLEVLVADDGSRDRTRDVVRRFPRVRLLAFPHRGKARTLNAAADVAAGEVLLFLDADLVFAPDYVERLVLPIVAGTCVGTAHGSELVANPRATWSRCLQMRAGQPPDARLQLSGEDLAAGSPVFRAVRADAFKRVGGFDDVGYLDDQTLAPKLGARALWVTGASCRHYGLETLGEVFALGAWSGRSLGHLHGPKALLRANPVSGLGRGIGQAIRHRHLPLVAFEVAHSAGAAWGVLSRLAARRGSV